MRGPQTLQGGIFSYVSLESRIPEDHPLRAIRRLVDAALEQLSRRFDGIYAKGVGRPSVPPEQLLRALLLQVLYTIRSERQLIEQIDYNLLYRWFVGLELDDEVFSATVFTKNRERLLKGEIAQHFFEAVLAQAESEGLVSSEHFTVDGTLIEAWASQKSFVRKDEKRRDDDDPGNPTVNFRGEKRSNQTHASRTDPDARLAGMRGQGARLAYQGHVVTENRNGLVVAAKLTQASGYAEREAALEMVLGLGGARRITLAGDKGLRRQELCAGASGLERYPARATEHDEPPKRDRSKDHRTPGLRGEPALPQTGGGGVWLDEDGGLDAQDPAPGHGSGRLGLHLHCCGLQPGPYPQPVGGDIAHDPARSTRATPNRFVPGTAIPLPARHASRQRRPAQPSHFLRSLLTLDQLARAAGLVCALELEREEAVARYGKWPFEIGLWVGKAATPNILGRKGDGRADSARSKVSQFKGNPDRRPSPIPLENCPWCGTRFQPESFSLEPDSDQPRNLRIVCTNFECDFTRDRALPIVAVDEPLYRRLPAFLIATVDKFASLPWVGRAGALLGGAERKDATGFYGGAEPGKGTRLAAPLPPPDLVIQDELHLISGPLGTMAGLYEAAIEALCASEVAGRTVRPKIVASTATARRARDQIQALFARPITQVSPPSARAHRCRSQTAGAEAAHLGEPRAPARADRSERGRCEPRPHGGGFREGVSDRAMGGKVCDRALPRVHRRLRRLQRR